MVLNELLNFTAMDPLRVAVIRRKYKKEGICVYVADSLCCTVETNTIL